MASYRVRHARACTLRCSEQDSVCLSQRMWHERKNEQVKLDSTHVVAHATT
ncbi:unnamed protein product (plasmid) [Mycetohabitans rhizoxinica HKI 454]|uniref:Uncharacterized protein n=1 Tax=Mycetohabitans rhizoxinica (strain DSM 19002 / CIP 109453 / HKI 454) TaxID=882378 RepID=E5AVU8_MYCRK|nr:unnamed protein product [Mycetohabitans rhizoxinica HKI 454]